jgi:hypothetical protein
MCGLFECGTCPPKAILEAAICVYVCGMLCMCVIVYLYIRLCMYVCVCMYLQMVGWIGLCECGT